MKEAEQYVPGEMLEIYVNQGYREAIVLAAIGNKRLIEYSMPNGTTALSFLDMTDLSKRVAISYWSLPTKWLTAIIDQGAGFWTGNPQQNSQGPVPSPTEMLQHRKSVKDKKYA
jgi:hypothetical protein